MTDQELLDEWRALMPSQLARVMEMPNKIITVDDPMIIKAAWGPRIVTSRTRGMEIYAYPESLTAHRSMFIDWMTQHGMNGERRPIKVVIAKKKAQARIDAALGHMWHDPEMQQTEPVAQITQDEIDDLMAERAELRAARRFEDADKIRDYLVRFGVVVSDGKVKQ